MTNIQSVVVFISLVLFVVGQLCQVTRSMNLRRLALDQRNPIVLLKWFRIPNLGRFAFFHYINSTILSLSVLLVIYWADGVIGSILNVLAVLIFVLLPIMEVDEYDQLLDSTDLPTSLQFHGILSILIVGLVLANLFIISLSKYGPESTGILAVTLLFSPMVYTLMFVLFLKSDLSKIETDHQVSYLH